MTDDDRQRRQEWLATIPDDEWQRRREWLASSTALSKETLAAMDIEELDATHNAALRGPSGVPHLT